MEDRSRRRARLVLFAGVFLAAIAGIFTFFYAQTTKAEAPAPIPTTDVIVAAREIPPKTQITTADLNKVKINTDAAPPAAIHRAEDVVGKVTITSITVGEPILPTKLAGANNVPFLVIPADFLSPQGAIQPNTPQYRAMSITVADPQAAGGAIQAGDFVDVLYTMQFTPERFILNPNPQVTTADATSRIVLERVPILMRNLNTYVIRTDAATAERIGWLGAAGGSIQLLLRAPKDDRATGTVGASFDNVNPEVRFHFPKRVPAN